MLKQRVLTALVLLMVLIPALVYPRPEPFFFIALVFIAAAGWEWARMNGVNGLAAWLAGGLCVLACGWMWWAGWVAQPWPGLWLAAGGVWVIVSAAPGCCGQVYQPGQATPSRCGCCWA